MDTDPKDPGADARLGPGQATDDGPGARLRASWDANAAAWTDAVRGGRIASRAAATDAAVLDAVLEALRGPDTREPEVLDVGCGEGWLAHALAEHGVRVTGIDASEALVRAASGGPGRFVRLDYGTLQADPHAVPGPFDAAVCNFALLDEDLAGVLRSLRARLRPEGRLVVQTLHPFALGAERYADAWHEETFDGFGGAFPAPMPWYARTLASWLEALADAGFALVRVREPRMEGVAWPVSLLMVAAPSETGGSDGRTV